MRSFPGLVSSGEETSEHHSAPTSWARRGVSVLGLIAVAGLICLLVGRWPAATVLSLGAGVLIRWIGHRLRWGTVLHGDAAQNLADFRMVNSGVECTFHENAINRYGRSQLWRVASAVAAGAVCITVLRFHWLPCNLLDPVRIPHWLAKTGFLCWPLLPLTCGGVFLWVRGPEVYGQEQLKNAIRSRATDAVTEIMRTGEIDGLEAGLAALYRQLDLWWVGEYRAAINMWIELHTAQAIFEPEAATAFIKAIAAQARADLNHLSEAAESFRSLECRQYVFETLIRATGESRTELVERAARWMDELRALAIAKRWDEFSGRAAEITGELDREITEFRLRSRSAVTLPVGTDPYRVLGAHISTSTPIIKKLRLRLAQVYHPDIGGETANDMKMAELNAAYDAVMRERSTP